MRYNDFDFDNETRLKVGSRIFNLQYVYNEGEQDAFLQLTAVEQWVSKYKAYNRR